MTVTGNLAINGSTGGTTGTTCNGATRTGLVASGTGSVTVGGNVTLTNSTAGPEQPYLGFGTGTLSVGGSLTVGTSATFAITTGTVNYNGGAQTVVALTYGGLTLGGSSAKTLGGNTTVDGVLTLTNDLNTGVNTLTLGSASTSTGAGDVIGNVSRTTIANGTTYDFGNGNVELTFTSGTPPTSMVVNLVKGSSPFTGAVSRQYTLTPTGGSGYAATVRLRYLETELGTNVETALNMYRYNSGTSTWDLQAPTTRDSVNNWVEKTGVTTFSPWALGTSSPTAVTLSTFSADGDSNTDALPFLGLGIGAIIALGGAIIARKKFSR